MNITVKRIAKRGSYTIGKMHIDGEYFCDTLEDTDRGLSQSMDLNEIKSKKVPGQTAIPTGTYKVIVNQSPKFKRNLPRLLAVPGFEGVLIHRGNTNKDTAGCILIGENKEVGKVINSTRYEMRLVNKLLYIQSNKENITITIS